MTVSQLEASKHLWVKEEDLKGGDWVYTPNKVFGATEEHNIFQYDERINYSQHFGDELIFYKLQESNINL